MAPERSTANDHSLDLQPREFGVALVMAATWYFLGPWGMVPTLWFLYLIVNERPGWLTTGLRLLPVAQRRALSARVGASQEAWRQLTAPWHEEEPQERLGAGVARSNEGWSDDPLGAALSAPAAPITAVLPSLSVITLAASDNLLIVGNRGSGKTTLLQAILTHRVQRCYVLDPHNHPGKWPAAVRVIGGGRAFSQIYEALVHSENQLDARAKQLNGDAHARFAPFTLASDEWGSVTSEILVGKDQDSPGRLLIRLLKEGRKFGISFIGCAHGDTAESLGSKGDTLAFRNSFDWIVYCGAFVATQLRDQPELVRQLPLGRTPEGGSFPLLVIAVSPVTGERRLLDLRTLDRQPARARPAPATVEAQPGPDTQTDEPLAEPIAPPAAPADEQTDRPTSPPLMLQSRDDIVRLLVAQGWTVSQIREVVKGDNSTIGAIVRRIEDEQLRTSEADH